MKTIACLLCAILYLLGSTSVCLADDAPLDIYDEEVSIDNYICPAPRQASRRPWGCHRLRTAPSAT